jgi:hypothetical protein
MTEGTIAASMGRRFISDLVDLVVAVVILLSGLNVAALRWTSSFRGPLVILATVGYFVIVAWIGRALGGLVTATRVVKGADGGRLSLGRAMLRAVALVILSFALALIAFGVGIGVSALSGLATGEAVWPLLASFAFAIIVPPLVDTAVGAIPGGRGLWDRLSGSSTTSTRPRQP